MTLRDGEKSKPNSERYNRLMPNDVPRWIRVYDNGGKTADRYIVVFSALGIGGGVLDRKTTQFWPILYMSAYPYHPQGVGIHGEANRVPDYPQYSHFGKKIVFADLPLDCQRLVISDYADYWHLDVSNHPVIRDVRVGFTAYWVEGAKVWEAPRPPKGKFDSRIMWPELQNMYEEGE